ncbi:MAG: AAA family ATPase [Dehalococcoidia bacterium]
MRQIAVYGKGGIGKSTVASNLCMALRERGLEVMQVGCDPKRDSTRSLIAGRLIPTVLETYRERLRIGQDQYAISLEDIVFQGHRGVHCVESGGPEPGIGCAGRGVLTAMQILRDLKAFDTYGVDVVVYDVLGDVVCGGFAQPIREGYAREIYLICSGAFMSIYAANNIAKAIRRLSRQGQTGLAGVIGNSSGNEQFEKGVLSHFAETLGSKLVHFIPRSPVIQACEVESKTVLEHSPQSPEAEAFRELAQQVIDNDHKVIPRPIEELSDLETLYREHLPQ